MSLKIYTKTGDKGETSLFGGKRVSKASLRVESYGTIDELESMLGSIVVDLDSKQILKQLSKDVQKIQLVIMEIGVLLARIERPVEKQKKEKVYIEKETAFLEKRIDEMTEKLPVLQNFITLGGSKIASYIFVTRAVCRRAERRIINLNTKESVAKPIIKYCNRLSDYLFTLGRFVNYKLKKKEYLWQSATQ